MAEKRKNKNKKPPKSLRDCFEALVEKIDENLLGAKQKNGKRDYDKENFEALISLLLAPFPEVQEVAAGFLLEKFSDKMEFDHLVLILDLQFISKEKRILAGRYIMAFYPESVSNNIIMALSNLNSTEIQSSISRLLKKRAKAHGF